MPPTPDRPRKPADPARGGQLAPSPRTDKPALAVPQKPSRTIPRPAAARPTPPARPLPPPLPPPIPDPEPRPERPRAWSLRLSLPVWWLGVFGLAVVLIICFEFGYSAGVQRVQRKRAQDQMEIAAAKSVETISSPGPKGEEPKTKSEHDSARPNPSTATPSSATPTPSKETKPAEPAKKGKPADSGAPGASRIELARPMESEKPAEPTVALKFDKDILPIFQSKCISCHGGLSKKGGLDLRSLASIQRGGNSGPGMKPGKPEDSAVWQSVKNNDMPPPTKPQLSADEKQQILKWIAGGGK